MSLVSEVLLAYTRSNVLSAIPRILLYLLNKRKSKLYLAVGGHESVDTPVETEQL